MSYFTSLLEVQDVHYKLCKFGIRTMSEVPDVNCILSFVYTHNSFRMPQQVITLVL